MKQTAPRNRGLILLLVANLGVTGWLLMRSLNTSPAEISNAIPQLSLLNPAEAASPAPSDDEFQPKSKVAAVAHQVSPAVVTVGTIARRQILVQHPRYFFSQYYIQNVDQRMPYLGSGSLIDDEGHIVTNYHVIERGDEYFVTFQDGRELEAKLVGYDPYIDIAVLKIDTDDLPTPIEMGAADDIQIGETVLALGSPFGPLIADPRPTVTSGVVSAVERTFRPDSQHEKVYQDMIQTDAAINPGNSGGPLVDIFGRMIGVNTFIFSGSGGSDGIGFAIPVDRVRRIVEEIKKYGGIRQLWLDFGFETLYGRNFPGVRVLRVESDGPAAKAGLLRGDIIIMADDRRVFNGNEFQLFFKGKQVGEELKLKVVRRDKELELSYTVEAPPSQLF